MGKELIHGGVLMGHETCLQARCKGALHHSAPSGLCCLAFGPLLEIDDCDTRGNEQSSNNQGIGYGFTQQEVTEYDSRYGGYKTKHTQSAGIVSMEEQRPKYETQSSDYHTLIDNGEHYSRI